MVLDYCTTVPQKVIPFKNERVTFNFTVVEDFQDAKGKATEKHIRRSSHELPLVRPPQSDDSVVLTNQTALNLDDKHPVADTSTTTLKREDKRWACWYKTTKS